MRVFISYTSKDRSQVEQLALALKEKGIDPWYDQWEIVGGDDIVNKMNKGLKEAEAGIIVFSKHTEESNWVRAEASYLVHANVTQGKRLIPVIIGESKDVFIPPLLKALKKVHIDQVNDLVKALKQGGLQPVTVPEARENVDVVQIQLTRNDDKSIDVSVRIGGVEHGTAHYDELPPEMLAARAYFQQGFSTGLRRSPEEAERHKIENRMLVLGQLLSQFCLPEESGAALNEFVQGIRQGRTIEVRIEASDSELLGLPFEALRLPGDQLLVLEEAVTLVRSPGGVNTQENKNNPGPLKILVAVGAPDEEQTTSVVLDQERELHIILDAVEEHRRRGDVQVRILEVGHPETIAKAIERDAYHVLHISCHGKPGSLEMEDEDGKAVKVTAEELMKPILETGKPLPLVYLNTCHGGVQNEDQATSFAQSLLNLGIPTVVAMQTTVSDRYATKLAGAFYGHLARRQKPLVSRALAAARKDVEKQRQKAIQQGGGSLADIQPEYATPAIYVAGEEQPIFDGSQEKVPLRERPVYMMAGPVPQLGIDDLIGRRRELRTTLRTLRDEKSGKVGVVLTGIGGVGKSALAGRAMQRLKETGWMVAAFKGRFELGGIASSIAGALLDAKTPEAMQYATMLANTELQDVMRLQVVTKVLAEYPLVLVLDDFEQNLAHEGNFLDPDVEQYLKMILQSTRKGRLLITCRYPIPVLESWLLDVPLGPLSRAESRKLLLRLPALSKRDAKELGKVLQFIGGHPRMLEFLDGLLRSGEGRLPHVSEKLKEVLSQTDISVDAEVATLDATLQQTLLLGARDVFLDELLAIAKEEGLEETLMQAAVSNLPVSPSGLAHMLAGEPADGARAKNQLSRLSELSLVHLYETDGSAIVHRWTAEGLAQKSDTSTYHAGCRRAGDYRLWRIGKEKVSLDDIFEAIRNYLAGEAFDEAAGITVECLNIFVRSNQTIQVAALGSEVLESLPIENDYYAHIADAEASAHLALGFTDRALERYKSLLQNYEQLVLGEPDRADYQRELSVSLEKMGNLYRALGQGEEARRSYASSLEIRQQLVLGEPDRADYQRDLSVSLEKMGDLYIALGQGEEARRSYASSLEIIEQLVRQEPDRADYQRHLSVAYNKMGDLYITLGQGEEARRSYASSLEIAERLVRGEPDRADYQRDLSVSYNKMGDLYITLGQGEEARRSYASSLEIRQQLVLGEPDRADYQRDLSVSLERMGDLYIALGQGEEARRSYASSLEIRQQLVLGEPDRADYQRDLSVSLEKMGDLYIALGQGEEARQYYERDLEIAEMLVLGEPDRADYQRDLAISHERMGGIYLALDQKEEARKSYAKRLEIFELLVRQEPDRPDHRRELSVSFEKMGDLYRAMGQGEEARRSYARSLEIIEQLVRGEPGRADYQRHLSVSYYKLGSLGGDEAAQNLQKALNILLEMKAKGILQPADEQFVEYFQGLISEIK